MRAHARLAAYAACVALTSSVGGAACSYDPHPVDGTLRCAATGECPEGYSCSACSTCWSNALDGEIGGNPSGNLPQPLLSRYVGQWALGTCSNVVTRCDDGFTGTVQLSPDSAAPSILTLDPGSASSANLVADWDLLCVLDLGLDAGGAHLYSRGQGCMDSSADPTLTWTARKFDVVTTSATTAVHSATYSRRDEYADLSVTNCIQTVHAALTKR